MRILFLSTTFPDQSASARGTYNAALCRALSEQHDVRVVAPRAFPEVVRGRLSGQCFSVPHEFEQLGIEVSYPTYWYTPRVLQHRACRQMWWSVRSELNKIKSEFRPEAVLSYWAHPEGAVGARFARESGIPSAVIVGGSDVLVLPRNPRRAPAVCQALLQSDAVITVSDGLHAPVMSLGVPAERIRTIYQGIDTSTFHSQGRANARPRLGLSSEKTQLLWIGRMVSVKAIEVLIDAVAILHADGRRLQLNLVGDGPLKPAMRNRVEQAGLNRVIRFQGAVGHDRLGDWYRAADLTVLSSDSEGLPNVLRESLACGTPFVATDVGSIREIADPASSRLVPPRNPQALAAAIEEMLQSDARQAAARYQSRTWYETAAETAGLLLNCQNRKSPSNAVERLDEELHAQSRSIHQPGVIVTTH